MASPDRALATMAMIDANAKRGKTHLDNFVPFALEALRATEEESLSPRDVATAVADEFGLRVPIQAMEAVLKRAVRERLAVRKSNRYSLQEENPTPLKNLKADQQKFLREQAGLCKKFVEYSSDVHSVALSIEDAESALYDQIERNTVALLSAEFKGAPYRQKDKIEVEHQYLAADFIAHVTRSDQTAYEWLVAAAKGTMLSAALHLPNQMQVGRKFSNTDLYLDAPLLLRLVGLEGEEAELSILEVVKSAKSYGANISAFAHSVSEAEGVILATVETRKRGNSIPRRSDGVLAYAIRMDLAVSELQVRCAKLASQLTSLGVSIREKPDSIPYLEVDELALTEELRQEVGYRYENALYRDVDSVRGIHFIRRRRSSVYIEDSRAVLITDNDAVARVARKLFRSEGYEWPVATVVSDLATILYLKEPQKAPEIPRLQMVAGAYSALEPGVAVWNAWLDAIDQLTKAKAVSSDDIALLCHTEESRRILMQVTLGNVNKVGTATVQDVLSETRRQVAAPYEAKARARETEAIAASAKAQVMTRVAGNTERKLDEMRTELDEIKTKNEQYIDMAARRKESIESAAAKFASKVVSSTLLFLVVVASLWCVLSLVGILPSSHVLAIAAAAVTAVFMVGALQQLFGGHVKQWLAPIERRIAKRRSATLKEALGGDEAA